MLKRIRFSFSLNLIAGLLLSTLILSKPIPTKACPVIPPPKTLLSLYLGSDLIFVADLISEKEGKILNDEEEYYSIEIHRDLKISSVLKGKPPRNFVFTNSDYRNKKPVEERNEEIEEEAEYEYTLYGYKGFSKLGVGERYLFFFRKNNETQQFELTDEVSGYKKLSDADLSIYKKRINELKTITKNKDNQLAAITKWLIRCIEEPSTRWDGAFDLNASFESLEYEDEEEESEEEESSAINKIFYGGKAEIAKNLSDSQKEYISSILFSSIHQEMSKNNFDDFYFGLSNLVSRWDKMRLVMYAYSFFQTADKSDTKKTKDIMEYISNILDDDELEEISSSYPTGDSLDESEELGVLEGEDIEAVNVETVNNTEENAAVAENSEENTDVEQTTDVQQNSDIKAEAKKEIKPRNLTPAQVREKAIQKFIARYEHLLARGFTPDEENELTDN
ncbi:MAG TPA: hypothetical protein VK892_23810 [Pyrinomonadaceae bacterium]|nr:hypothetical protein [Pyrinomonadaceae bacterium]